MAGNRHAETARHLRAAATQLARDAVVIGGTFTLRELANHAEGLAARYLELARAARQDADTAERIAATLEGSATDPQPHSVGIDANRHAYWARCQSCAWYGSTRTAWLDAQRDADAHINATDPHNTTGGDAR